MKLCLTASLTIVFIGKEQRMWGGIVKNMFITLPGHINLIVELRYMFDQPSVLLFGANNLRYVTYMTLAMT